MTFRHPVILVVWQSFPIEEVVSLSSCSAPLCRRSLLRRCSSSSCSLQNYSGSLLVLWSSSSSESCSWLSVTSHRQQRHGKTGTAVAAESYGFLSKIAEEHRAAWRSLLLLLLLVLLMLLLLPSRIVCHQPITRPAIHRDPPSADSLATANERVNAAWRDFYRAWILRSLRGLS